MKNKRRERKLSNIADQRRKKKAEKEVEKDPWKGERWFEFTEYFDPHQIVPVVMKDTDMRRMFVLGTIEGLAILQVPPDSERDDVQKAITLLSERGIRAIAFGDHVRFAKLRMCSADEEELLNQKNIEGGEANVINVNWPPKTAEEETEGVEPEVLGDKPEDEEDFNGGADAGSDVVLASERHAESTSDTEEPEH